MVCNRLYPSLLPALCGVCCAVGLASNEVRCFVQFLFCGLGGVTMYVWRFGMCRLTEIFTEVYFFVVAGFCVCVCVSYVPLQ